ncbi:radical SAM protein [Clostridium sporogenes]|uniref:radical SAM/SPASM domain-containing protein n=1 Tax=unclassified Clostridium TaxID=2614128 RepID=UPI0013D6268F|nr:radical SAM protein [Clostridium sporogenes]NFS24224.1 radical SAM protein [Clostridium sporogenes]
MNITFIEDEKRDDMIIFFPNSFKFFTANKIVKNIFEEYKNGSSLDCISHKFNLPYKQCKNIIVKIDESIENVENDIDLEQALKVFEYKLGKLSINVTDNCNLRCKYCYEQNENMCTSSRNISFKTIDNLLNVLSKRFNTIETIQFFGGEPFLNKDAIKYTCKKVMQLYDKKLLLNRPSFGIVTNGTIVDKEIMDLIKKYNINITVSFDGIPSVHDKMRISRNGKKTSNIILKNIKTIQKYNKKPLGFEVTYNGEHLKQNIKVIDIVKYLQENFNLSGVHITPVLGKEKDEFYLNDVSEFENLVDDLFKDEEVKFYPNYLINLITSLTKKKHSPFLCDAGISQISIDVDGNIYPCFMLVGADKYKMGTVYNENVFESDRWKELFKLFKSKRRQNNPKCKDCYMINLCNGCMGINNITNNSPFEVNDYFCDINKKMFKKLLFNIIDKQNLKGSLNHYGK